MLSPCPTNGCATGNGYVCLGMDGLLRLNRTDPTADRYKWILNTLFSRKIPHLAQYNYYKKNDRRHDKNDLLCIYNKSHHVMNFVCFYLR